MVAPVKSYRKTLTGRVRGRRAWFGKVLMQVEVMAEELSLPREGQPRSVLSRHYEWRDATLDDFLERIYGDKDENMER
jgi:hypothetical protein